MPTFRNVPILSANANQDQLCLTGSQLQVLDRFAALGYRYDWREYVGTHGPYYPTSDESAQFLGDAHVDPNPPHVTYVLDGAMQEPKWGLTANHAYWLSGMQVRDPSVTNDLGTVDAFSHGFGVADPVVNPEQATSGTSNAIPFTGRVRTWQRPRRVTATRELDVDLTNIAAVTVDPNRAHVGCDANVRVTSDGPATVRLAGCDRTVRVH